MSNSVLLLLQQLSEGAEEDKANGLEWNVFPKLILKLLNIAFSTKSESRKHRFQNDFMSKTSNVQRIDFVLEDFDMFKVIAKFSSDFINECQRRKNDKLEKKTNCIQESDEQQKLTENVPTKIIKENKLIKQASNCVRMKYNNEKGRIIVAEEEIEPGEIVMIEKAFVSWLRPSLFSTHCHHCLQLLKSTYSCPNCSLVKFCSSVCLSEALKEYHNTECRFLPILKYFAAGHLALRILIVVGVKNAVEFDQKGNISLEDWTQREFKSNYESLFSLVDHINDKKYQLLFPDVFGATLMSILAHKMGLIEGNEIRKVGAILLKHISQIGCNVMSIIDDKTFETNSFTRTTFFSDTLEIGAGMFPTICLMNHNCDPNVLNSFKGNYAISTVLEKVNVGEELLVTYGPHFKRMSFKDRQEVLKNRYLFECRCVACIEKKDNLSDAIRCSQCKESVILNLYSSSIKCSLCDNTMNTAAVQQRIKEANDLLLDYFKCMSENLKFEAYIKLNDCHRMLEEVVNDSHHLLILTKQEMAVMYETRFRFNKALQIASEVMDICKRLNGEQSLMYLLSLLRLIAITISSVKYDNKCSEKPREMLETALSLMKNAPVKETLLNPALHLQIDNEFKDIVASLNNM